MRRSLRSEWIKQTKKFNMTSDHGVHLRNIHHESELNYIRKIEHQRVVDHETNNFVNRGLFAFDKIEEHNSQLVNEFNVKTPSINTPTSSLSGGNIQKVILARELSASPTVLLACQPTRGVDIGAAEYIHNRLIEQRELGTATLLISEDLDELLTLSDRLLVMHEGEIVKEFDPTTAHRHDIGAAMAGKRDES